MAIIYRYKMNAHKITYHKIDPAQLRWVNRFYKQCRYDAKARLDETVVAACQNEQIVAALRLQPKPQHHTCLRSLCVAPSMRGQGIATALLQHVFNPRFTQICYCYALPHLSTLYALVGFTAQETTTLPEFIRLPYIRYVNRGQKLTTMIRYPTAHDAQPCDSALTHSVTCGKTAPKISLYTPLSCH